MTEGEKLYRWSKSVDDDRLDWWETELIAAGVAFAAEKTANRKRWRISAYQPTRTAAEKLKSRFGGGVCALRDDDWQPRGVIEIAPLKIRDRFVVTQLDDPGDLVALANEFPDREILSFPPRLAFGTGGHPTTAGCLRLLVDEWRAFSAAEESSWPMLDLGCGSGILAIAAAKLGADPVVGLELDPIALDIARENAGRHDAGDSIRFVEADAVDWVAADSSEPGFQIIAANLFSELLVAILPHLPKHLAPGGVVILSGFLTTQTREVNTAARKAGLKLDRFIRRGRWVAAAGRLAP